MWRWPARWPSGSWAAGEPPQSKQDPPPGSRRLREGDLCFDSVVRPGVIIGPDLLRRNHSARLEASLRPPDHLCISHICTSLSTESTFHPASVRRTAGAEGGEGKKNAHAERMGPKRAQKQKPGKIRHISGFFLLPKSAKDTCGAICFVLKFGYKYVR